MNTLRIILALVVTCGGVIFAQAPDVPVIRDAREVSPELVKAAKKLRDDGKLISMTQAREQLARSSCELHLPEPASLPLQGGEIWRRARAAHLRVGYLYLCTKCENLHLNLAGAYAITADGAVATCFHVVEPKDMKEGHLVAVTEKGTVVPVVEVLASNRANDVAIIRVQSETPLEPLPINASVRPGDEAWCYSDPFGRSSYFSKGIVNRFFQRSVTKGATSIRMNVSTDWAPGSSGSAVLDASGNAIGHVSEISAQGSEPSTRATAPNAKKTGQTYIVFHDAVRAADVLALVKAPR